MSSRNPSLKPYKAGPKCCLGAGMCWQQVWGQMGPTVSHLSYFSAAPSWISRLPRPVRPCAMEAPKMQEMTAESISAVYAGLFPDSDGDPPTMKDVVLKNKKRLKTYHWAAQERKGLIVLVHGFGEHLGRYFHVANFFVKQGWGSMRYTNRNDRKVVGQMTERNPEKVGE